MITTPLITPPAIAPVFDFWGEGEGVLVGLLVEDDIDVELAEVDDA
jgi:hypothetical protein